MSNSCSTGGLGPRATLLALAAIVALGLLVRGECLGTAALADDESYSWRLSREPVAEIWRRTGADVHPPLYYVLLRGWVAVFGDSVAAMRSLSVLCGAAVAPLLFLVVLEGAANGAGGPRPVDRSSALLAAFLVATNAAQVEYSRTARMYPLGVLLGGLGAWTLLRALRPGGPRAGWWLAYGATASAFLWTHNAAVFTVAAQGLWAAAMAARCLLGGEAREAMRRLLGLAGSAAVVLATYGPWFPVAARQFGEVRRKYWIAPLGWEEAGALLATWGTGMPAPGPIATLVALAAMAVAVGWVLVRRDRLGGFLLLQAALPWALALGLWLTTGRPILLERLMAFAQLAAFGTWAAVVRQVGDPVARAAVAGILVLSSLTGLAGLAFQHPAAPQVALERAAAYLGAQARPGDLVLANDPIAVNRVRHAMGRAGVTGLDVRCSLRRRATDGHITHATSLAPEDVVWIGPDAPPVDVPARVWTVRDVGDRGGDPPLVRELVRDRTASFEAGGAAVELTLHVRAGP